MTAVVFNPAAFKARYPEFAAVSDLANPRETPEHADVGEATLAGRLVAFRQDQAALRKILDRRDFSFDRVRPLELWLSVSRGF